MNEDNERQPESDRIQCNDRTSGKLCNSEMENQSKYEQTENVLVEANRNNLDPNGLSNPEPKTFEEDKKQNLKFILNNDESLIKFIDGEEIVDKQNPFKKEENGVRKVKVPNKKLKFGRKPSNMKANENQKALILKNDEFVTKEDVLKESKYVKTYVKNPDKYLTYDKSVLEKFSLLKQKKSSIKKPSASNIPIVYNKEPEKIKAKSIVAPSRPALKFKVKTNIDSDESLYDSNEVTINVLKFDSRFKSAEFGSQDDIEDIAEMTSTDCDEKDTSKGEEENEKKTFTNTVTSNDFKEFLKRKGLTLVPNRLVSSENKPSVIKRFFHTKTTNNISSGNLYPTRYQTCPADKILSPLSPSSQSDSLDSVKPLRRVIFNDPVKRSSIMQKQRNVLLSDQFNTGDERSNSSMSTDSLEAYRIRKREITYPRGMVQQSKIPTKLMMAQRDSVNKVSVYGQIKNVDNYSNKIHLSPYNYINLHRLKKEADSMINSNRNTLPHDRKLLDENIYDYASLERKPSSHIVYGEINHINRERPRSLDKQHILNEIYNFYRRSVSFKNDKTKNNIYSNTMATNVAQNPTKSNGLYENVVVRPTYNKDPINPQLRHQRSYNYKTNIENLYAYVRNKLEIYGQSFTKSTTMPQDIQRQPNKSGKLVGSFDEQTNDLQIIEECDPADRRRQSRGREDPRRHTLGGDMMQYVQGQGPIQQRSMDLEMGTHSLKSRKAPPMRSYTPSNQGPLFDDDPGIMSEVETASTGFRRGGKQRSSLPVVRTPSKTLERPLGLVFLQYRSETKRALLPNEITSIDTVRALFVRSFPRQLTMAYLEGPNVKIYIHDSSKDMFYELEDVRSHLREIKDRSVLRLFESNEVGAPQLMSSGMPCSIPQQLPPTTNMGWDQDQSYFSEPEFDSEYQHQHIHKSKSGKVPYYGAQTLPRGMYSDRNKNSVGFPNQDDQDERGSRGPYDEEPYYSQYGSRGSNVAPIIDEEQCDAALTEDQYAVYGTKSLGRIPRHSNQIYDAARPEDLHRMRVEHMERQLANLTGLVQKALIQGPQVPVIAAQNYLGVPGQYRGDKSVSFEKSVSFSDDIQGIPKTHSPQHLADSKPPKPAIKSSTLPRTSSQEKDRLKPAPPPKPLVLATSQYPQYRTDLTLAPEVYNHLRGLQKKAKDLRTEVRTLRRLAQTQAVAVREDIKDTFMKIRATLLTSNSSFLDQDDQEKIHLNREEEIYKQEVIRLEKDLSELESSVEGLRGEVINRRTRVNMAAVEDMALVLSRASKTVAELKMKFPTLQQGLRNVLATEMEKVCREEKFLKDEPDRLESALRRCKKLTGTLVTLKRLASVQEQRLPVPETTVTEESTNKVNQDVHVSTNKPIPSPRCLGPVSVSGGIAPENALDALLDELQTFAKPPNNEHRPDDSTSDDSSQTLQNTTITTKFSQSQLYPSDPVSVNIGLRRLHSYPSGSDTDTSPPQPPRPAGKPPVPERNAELLSKVNNKRVPPPPPPRTSSRSPLASPTSPNMPARMQSISEQSQYNNDNMKDDSSSESVSSDNSQRQLALEMRHQELLKKQKQLQEQYQRLQQLSKNSIPLAPTNSEIVKTVSESNLSQKSDGDSSSMTQFKPQGPENNNGVATDNEPRSDTAPSTKTTNKVYETDIL